MGRTSAELEKWGRALEAADLSAASKAIARPTPNDCLRALESFRITDAVVDAAMRAPLSDSKGWRRTAYDAIVDLVQTKAMRRGPDGGGFGRAVEIIAASSRGSTALSGMTKGMFDSLFSASVRAGMPDFACSLWCARSAAGRDEPRSIVRCDEIRAPDRLGCFVESQIRAVALAPSPCSVLAVGGHFGHALALARSGAPVHDGAELERWKDLCAQCFNTLDKPALFEHVRSTLQTLSEALELAESIDALPARPIRAPSL